MKIGAKSVADMPQRRKLTDQLPRAAYERPDRKAHERTRTEMRIEPVTDCHPGNDRAEIEIARCHGRWTEDMFGIQYSHHQRRERYHQHEWPHDPGQQNRQ